MTKIRLNSGELWSTPVQGSDLSLFCIRGKLWVTQDGHAEDTVVQAGGYFSLAPKGKMVVQALSSAQFVVGRAVERCGPKHLKRGFQRLVGRIRKTVSRIGGQSNPGPLFPGAPVRYERSQQNLGQTAPLNMM